MARRVYHPKRMTADSFFTLPDDGHRYELINGDLQMAPAPSANVHQYTVGRLYLKLAPFIEGHRLGSLWFAPVDVVLSAHDVLQPDLLFVRSERADIVGGRVHGAPDLVVEVVSPDSEGFDRGLKMHRYSRFGVLWYWIVDPRARTIDELELSDGQYVQRQLLSGNDQFTPVLFPGLVIDLGGIWPVLGA